MVQPATEFRRSREPPTASPATVPRVVPGSESPVGGEIQGSSKGTLRCLELDAVAEGSMKVSRDTNLYRFTQLYV